MEPSGGIWRWRGSWPGGEDPPRIQAIRPVEGNTPIPRPHSSIPAGCRIQATGHKDTRMHRMQDADARMHRMQDADARNKMMHRMQDAGIKG